MWEIRKFLFMLLLCLLLGMSVGTCSAQYQVTNSELESLETIFQQLGSNNEQLLIDLELSKTDLMQARLKLVEYQRDLTLLQVKLLQLKEESQKAKTELETAQGLLDKANQSLTKLNKEVKSEIRGLKMQRDLSILAAVAIAVYK